MTLGEREQDAKHLAEAVAIFGEALKEATRERVPALWATLQMNLGVAVQRLGDRGGDARRLEMAMTCVQGSPNHIYPGASSTHLGHDSE